MEIGPIGETGSSVVWRVAEEHKVELGRAPIPRHNLEAGNVLEKAKTGVLVTNIHVQVNTFTNSYFHCILYDSICFHFKINISNIPNRSM